MKLFLAIFIFLSGLAHAEKKKSNSSGPDSPVVVGIIKTASGNRVEVQQGQYLRKLTLNKKSKVVFVSFLGAKEEFKAGYSVKAKVAQELINSIYITLPIGEVSRRTPDMSAMSALDLFKKADQNQDGEVCYRELSRVIHYSPKHGPDTFTKVDKDKSGTLDQTEFSAKLKSVDWWKLSQKSPLQWLAFCDKDKNGQLSPEEFAIIAGEGHLESRFKRTDKDKSGAANLKELTAYISNVVQPKAKKK